MGCLFGLLSEAEAHVGSSVMLGNRDRDSYLRQRQLYPGRFPGQQSAEPQLSLTFVVVNFFQEGGSEDATEGGGALALTNLHSL